MTHDELRVDISVVKAANKLSQKYIRAVEAVFELHKPQEITLPNGEWGTNCVECDNRWNYPCRTIETIEKELV